MEISNEDILKTLGKRIKEIRKRKKLKQKEVAYRCGFYPSGYNNIESGTRNISVLTLYKIAFVLEEPISIFFEDKDFHFFLKNHKKE